MADRITDALAKIEAAAKLAKSVEFHEMAEGFHGLADGMVELAKLLAERADG